MSTLLATLGVVCPSCEVLNAAGAKNCTACRSSLLDGPAPAAARPAKPAPVARSPSSSGVPLTAAKPVAAPPPGNVPPGLRPTGKTVTSPQMKAVAKAPAVGPTPAPVRPAVAAPSAAPIPASELLKKPAGKPSLGSSTAAGPRFGLVVLAGPAKGQRFRLPASGAVIGKSRGAILFPDDPYLSAQHATIVIRDGKVLVRDDSTVSGVFVTISGQETVASNCYFSTGQRLFRYAGAIEPAAPYSPGQVTSYGAPVPPGQVMYRIQEVLVGDREGMAYVTPGPTVTIGQHKCDLMFPADEGLAPRHCEVSPMPTGAMIRDLSGGLGTFVRIARGVERPLKPGDRLRVGQEILQLEAIPG
jgi:pSer/pThr/pTyr-binding forkhead associated (FHA) protein